MSSPSMASPSRQVPSPLNLPSRDRCSPSASEFTARAHTPSSSSGRRQDPQQASSFVNHSRRMHPISSLRPVRAEQFKDWNGTGPQQDHIQCSFEWPIYDLRALKVHVQDNAAGLRSTGAEMSSPLELPEALRNGVVIGDGYYKLDIGMLSTFEPLFCSCPISCV